MLFRAKRRAFERYLAAQGRQTVEPQFGRVTELLVNVLGTHDFPVRFQMFVRNVTAMQIRSAHAYKVNV